MQPPLPFLRFACTSHRKLNGSIGQRLSGNSRRIGLGGFQVGIAFPGSPCQSGWPAGGFFSRGTSLIHCESNPVRHGSNSVRGRSNLVCHGSNSFRHGLSFLSRDGTRSVTNQTQSVADQTLSVPDQTHSVTDQTRSAVDQTPSAPDQTQSVVPQTAWTAENGHFAAMRPVSGPSRVRSPFDQSQSRTETHPKPWHKPRSLGTEPTRREIHCVGTLPA